MTHLTGNERSAYVQDMFTRIAPRYDMMNRLMTFGQDMHWRRLLIEKAAIPPGGRVIDLGSGTGDIAIAVRASRPDVQVAAADFTLEMMRRGRERPGGRDFPWSSADALNLPFRAGAADAVVSGFLMRNVSGLPRALREQHRVLKPGGRIVILDTTRPPENALAPFIRFHLNVVIPALGRWLTGEGEAYTYLPDSTTGFLRAETLAARMQEAGFTQVAFTRLMAGTIALHWGVKRMGESASRRFADSPPTA